MVHAKSLHLERVADSEIPVVVCPRSNIVTGVGRPPVEHWLTGRRSHSGRTTSCSTPVDVPRDGVHREAVRPLGTRGVSEWRRSTAPRSRGLSDGLIKTGQPDACWCSTGIRTISAAHERGSGSRSSGSHRPTFDGTGEVTLLNPGSHAQPRGHRTAHAELEPMTDGGVRGRLVD